MSTPRRRWTSAIFNGVWAFGLALLLSPTFRSWVPFAQEHTFAYLAIGFMVCVAMVLVNFSDYRASRRQAPRDEQ